MTGIPPEMDSFDVPPPKPSQQLQVELSAGDRDTLTDDERARLRYSDGSRVSIRGEILESTVEQIVAARVRAAQAQAWAEGRAAGFMKRPAAANPYRSEPGDEFQNPED